MAHTPWVGDTANKLYLQSGQFTSTLKTSEAVGTIDASPLDISYNGENTPWIGNEANKLYMISGQFTSTLKTSQDITAKDATPLGISIDSTNTPWSGTQFNSLILTSGKFTSTIKDSLSVGSVDGQPRGISYDGTNTPWAGGDAPKLHLQSGQFESTLKTSESITGIDSGITGISWDGTNTPWCGVGANKLYLTSGQFTSTIKDSEDISGVDTSVRGICTNDFSQRMGGIPTQNIVDNLTISDAIDETIVRAPISPIYITDPLTITDGVLGWTDAIDIEDTLTITDTVELSFNVIDIVDYLAISDSVYQPVTYERSVTDTFTISDSVDEEVNSYSISDQFTIVDYVDLNDIKERTAGNILTITDSVSIEQDYAFKIIDGFTISDTVEVTVPLNIVIEDELTISDETGGIFQYNLEVENEFDILYIDPDELVIYRIMDKVELQLIAGRSSHQFLTLQQTVQVSHEKASATSKSITSTLTITDSAEVARSYGHTLIITDSVSVSQGKGVRNDLEITDTVVLSKVVNEGLTDPLMLSDTIGYILEQAYACPVSRLYMPFVGVTTDGNAPTPPSTSEPSVTVYDNVRLSYPTTSPTLILVLRGPELGNRDRQQYTRISRESRGGTLIVSANPAWPNSEQLNLQFVGLTEVESQDILDFLRDSLGKEIKLRDWEGKEWTVITTSPDNPFQRNGYCKNSISLDFESIL